MLSNEEDLSNSEISISTKSSYYVKHSNSNDFYFYYKTTQNGIDGFTNGMFTIGSNDDVFITHLFEGTPTIIVTTTIYEYPISKFEKIWLSTNDISSLQRVTKKLYEIYVPEGSIIETSTLSP